MLRTSERDTSRLEQLLCLFIFNSTCMMFCWAGDCIWIFSNAPFMTLDFHVVIHPCNHLNLCCHPFPADALQNKTLQTKVSSWGLEDWIRVFLSRTVLESQSLFLTSVFFPLPLLLTLYITIRCLPVFFFPFIHCLPLWLSFVWSTGGYWLKRDGSAW